MARPFSSPSAVATFFALLGLIVVIAIFSYFQFGYLPAQSQSPVTSQYPISKVVSDMRQGGPYDEAQALVPSSGSSSGTSGSPTVVSSPAPVVSAADLGKTDLSKFNQ